jgi:uncharacterized Ntn-hydrolase superfamily protein
MTFSIIGIDKKNKELGIACFSKAFAVGGIVPEVKLEIGAVATQSYPNISYKEEGIELMKKFSPSKVVEILTNKDKYDDIRQVIIMNNKGESAGFSGERNVKWKGHLKGKNFICAGNMLVGERVLLEMKKSFENSKGSLAERLIKSLIFGERVGGDKRKRKFGSAGLIIEKQNYGVMNIGNRYIDLRVDYSFNAIKDLQKLLNIRFSNEKKWRKNKRGCKWQNIFFLLSLLRF